MKQVFIVLSLITALWARPLTTTYEDMWKTIDTHMGKWFVIVGGARTFAEAQKVTVPDSIDYTITISSMYDNLNPFWFVAVTEVFDDEATAAAHTAALKKQGLNAYYKYAGSFWNDCTFYPTYTEIRSSDIPATIESHSGFRSADGAIYLTHHHSTSMSDSISLHTHGYTLRPGGAGYANNQTSTYLWNKSNTLVAAVHEDHENKRGDKGIYFIDVQTGTWWDEEIENLVTGGPEYSDNIIVLSKDLSFSKDEEYFIKNLAWIDETHVYFEIHHTKTNSDGSKKSIVLRRFTSNLRSED